MKLSQLVSSSESSLRNHLQKGEMALFAQKLIALYPTAAKFYAQECEQFLEVSKANAYLALFKKISIQSLVNYEGFEHQNDKIILKKIDGSTEEYPTVDLNLFIQSLMKIDPNQPGYFLIVSFFLQPRNLDAAQLFNIFNRKRN